MRVLIAGAGAIGAAIAYYLSLRGIQPVVIERTGPAAAASGKSGGFLALDWCDGTALAALARRSFALHAELASTLDGEWGYRRMDTLGVVASARRGLASQRRGPAPAWLAADAVVQGRLGTPQSTAQVHPARFTEALLRAALERGGELVIGAVEGVEFAPGGGRVAGLIVDGRPLLGDAVVLALGPWTAQAARWLPLPAIYGLKGHSLVFRTGDAVPAQALFVEYEAADGSLSSPEVFPRPDGTTYICGLPGYAPIPADAGAVAVEPGAEAALRATAARLSPVLAEAEVLAVQACYRPSARDGLPVLGRIAGVRNAFIATGHGVWGILNAPATGEAMAELIAEGRSRLDLSPFDPARLPPARA